jgi:hypothetical protein
MSSAKFVRFAAKAAAAGIGFGAAAYATYAGVAWLRYGKTRAVAEDDADPLLDVFMPGYEVADRHHIRVAAPPEITLSAAAEIELGSCPVVRAIFKGRELILRSKPVETVPPRGLLSEMKALGWGVLAEHPGREIVMGGVTKPWEPNPVFRALPPDEFAAFEEPGYVKIVWTLRADPSGGEESIFRTETRAIATDAEARKKFRRYWALLSPGIIGIRTVMLPAIKGGAERRVHAVAA